MNTILTGFETWWNQKKHVFPRYIPNLVYIIWQIVWIPWVVMRLHTIVAKFQADSSLGSHGFHTSKKKHFMHETYKQLKRKLHARMTHEQCSTPLSYSIESCFFSGIRRSWMIIISKMMGSIISQPIVNQPPILRYISTHIPILLMFKFL